jgi:hypothetical protein
MRRSVRKHYEKLARFVDVANLGWPEILENNNFPTLEELTSGRKHRALLQRIDRALRGSFPLLKIPDRVPPLFHQDWSKCPSSSWRRFHSYANRKFRARTGLKALHHGRQQRLALHQAIQTETAGLAPEDPPLPGLLHK